MTSDKRQRIGTAVGFLSGLLACLDVLRDARVFWPPEIVWDSLHGTERLELGGGIALIVVTLVIWVGRQRET